MILIRYGPKPGEGKMKLIVLIISDYEKFNELRQNATGTVSSIKANFIIVRFGVTIHPQQSRIPLFYTVTHGD